MPGCGDYLADRHLQVTIGGKISAQHSIRAGVPQGSALVPALFLLYVADIDKCLLSDTRLSSFADDTTVYTLALSNDLRETVAALQETLDNLHDWGRQWRIRFKPAKSQLLVISKACQQPPLPPITFGGTAMAVAEYLKLLGVPFDSNLAFRHHLHGVSTRPKQRLGFLHCAARVLDHQGRVAAYKGFIRPVLEYAPLAWMDAAKSHLDRLDRIQRSALHILGSGILLQSLRIRRTVAALAYLYKLHYTTGPPQLEAMVPPPATRIQNDRPTRSTRARHASQLQLPSRNAPDYARRSFPFSVVVEWNTLPVDLLRTVPHAKGLQTFKEKVFHHLTRQNWEWSTDSL